MFNFKYQKETELLVSPHSFSNRQTIKEKRESTLQVGVPGNLKFQVKCELPLQLRTKCMGYIVRQDKG